MGVLDRFEKGHERAVDGAFAKAFRSEVQPVEIASALCRALDDRAEPSRMMQQVVLGGTGTRAQIPGVTVTGTTGAAQQGPGQPPHAWFTAFAPAGDPRVAIAVVVEDGGSAANAAFGGTVTAPIATAVMEAVLRR
ncbi:MAG: FhaA domain-containing protein [Dermatophilaceae bacterium]